MAQKLWSFTSCLQENALQLVKVLHLYLTYNTLQVMAQVDLQTISYGLTDTSTHDEAETKYEYNRSSTEMPRNCLRTPLLNKRLHRFDRIVMVACTSLKVVWRRSTIGMGPPQALLRDTCSRLWQERR